MNLLDRVDGNAVMQPSLQQDPASPVAMLRYATRMRNRVACVFWCEVVVMPVVLTVVFSVWLASGRPSALLKVHTDQTWGLMGVFLLTSLCVWRLNLRVARARSLVADRDDVESASALCESLSVVEDGRTADAARQALRRRLRALTPTAYRELSSDGRRALRRWLRPAYAAFQPQWAIDVLELAARVGDIEVLPFAETLARAQATQAADAGVVRDHARRCVDVLRATQAGR